MCYLGSKPPSFATAEQTNCAGIHIRSRLEISDRAYPVLNEILVRIPLKASA